MAVSGTASFFFSFGLREGGPGFSEPRSDPRFDAKFLVWSGEAETRVCVAPLCRLGSCGGGDRRSVSVPDAGSRAGPARAGR